MFHEEKIINNKLHHRSTPWGEWTESTGAYADAVNAVVALEDEKRVSVFGFFCTRCGTLDSGCQCWNDD
jgi:hypothetical protein